MTVELVRPPRPWFDDRQRLADLFDWLKEQGHEPDDFAYFIRRAEKWTPHYEDMIAEEREEESRRLYEDERALESERRYFNGGDEAA
jgi:hypothetical protein